MRRLHRAHGRRADPVLRDADDGDGGVAGEVRLGGGWLCALDVDALAGGPGRAEDAALKLAYDVRNDWRLAAGYRTVEGGANVPSVYAFAWLHYAVLSVTRRF